MSDDQLKMPAALLGKKGLRRDSLRSTAGTALAGTALASESDHGMFGMVTALIVK